VTHDFGSVYADACGLTGVHTVTFTTVDACANETTCVRTITFEDTIEPTIEMEAQDLELECADPGNAAAIAAWEAAFGNAVASDECSDDPLLWAIIDQVEIPGCGSQTTTVYTFQVTDNCANTSTTVASVIIEDTTPPELIVPIAQVEECGNIVVDLATWQAEATSTDDCGVVTIDAVLWNTTSGCGGTEIETYLFTATDECGNETTGLADYELEDTSTPTIVCPPELMLVCGSVNNDQLILQWLESATATDEYGCSDVTITHDLPGGLPDLDCDNPLGTTITFTATDACGNSSSCTSIITMFDDEDPYFVNCSMDLTVNADVDLCETNVVYSTPVAQDNCDNTVDVTLIDGPASGTTFPIGTTTVTFLATDGCGNTSTCSFDITVLDSGIPNIDCPSNNVVVCTDLGTCTWVSDDQTDPIFNDNCGGEVTYTITGETTATSAPTGVNTVAADGVIFNVGASLVTYTITDPSGNTFSCDFTVIVEDCENPTITCNDILDVPCGSEDVDAWIAAIVEIHLK